MGTLRGRCRVGGLGGLGGLAVLLLGLAACSRGRPVGPTAPPAVAADPPLSSTNWAAERPEWFREVAAASGLDATYKNGEEAGHMVILEQLGGGVALFDYDGDGLLDIFLTGGGYFAGPDKKEIRGHPSRLYRNLGGGRFRNVTAEVGLDGPLFYSHGCFVADYDNDGWPDLLVTGWGRLALYHNVAGPAAPGGRRFKEITGPAGLNDRLWSTSAAWGDLDGDGFADLYVCHYVDWSFANNPSCHYHDPNLPDVCPPMKFNALPHTLYRNNRDGTFTDVSRRAGLHEKGPLENGKGLGVVLVDVDDDGRPDIYVANDATDNLLYLNRGEMRFEEVGLGSGVARDDVGLQNGSMGVAVGDYLGSGRPALFVTNYENQPHALYRNDGNGQFSFQTQAAGIMNSGVGWGTGFLDLDNRGQLDLVITNGHVIRFPREHIGVSQLPLLYYNQGRGRYRDITPEGGPYFQSRHGGRGLALGDLENRGLTDLVVSHVNEPVAVLRNLAPLPAVGWAAGNHWLGVGLAGRGNRDVVGAKVVLAHENVTTPGGRQTRFAVGGGSYLSSSDPRHRFGLGQETRSGRLTVVWPSGEPRTQHWEGLGIDRYWRLVQGKDAAEPAGGPDRIHRETQSNTPAVPSSRWPEGSGETGNPPPPCAKPQGDKAQGPGGM